ncbi:MAG: NlpC/P60 family protein [Lachnospiraceae bacterium]|nr:NlpC/P60 family protein [Lachnospiraceae bacterium]
MKFTKVLMAGMICTVAIAGVSRQSVNVSAASMTTAFGNIGIASVTSSTLDEEDCIQYAESGENNLWGYTNLGIAQVEEGNLNVRSGPSTDDSVVGKMTNNAACEILFEKDGWYYITSGEVEGYVSAEFIITGVEAKVKALSIVYTKAVVQTDGLNVRTGPGEEYDILTQVATGEELEVVAVSDGWVECVLNTDTVYVSEEYVEIVEGLDTAVTLSSLQYGSGVSSVRVSLVDYALQFVGNPYVWGGTSLTNGADCSGFVLSVYAHFGYSLPHSSAAQANCGTRISTSELQPGDLLFYGSSASNISHVAIYIGNGQIVHASDERSGIKISNYNYRTPVAAVRILS